MIEGLRDDNIITKAGGRFKLVVPLGLDDLLGGGEESADEFTVFDELGAHTGCRVAVSEGAEAAMPFYPERKPLDAYAAAILDTVSVEPMAKDNIC